MTTATAMEYAGDSGAHALSHQQFEAFYALTARALRAYICRMAGSAAMADDILQESYIRLLVAPPMAEENRKAYLYRTATNLVIDQWRSQRRHRKWWSLWPRRQEAAAQSVELASDMGRLFQLIAPRERALLWLAYVEGADHCEIAAVLQLKEKSVKVLLFRARRKMEAILKDHGFEDSHD
ncbi:MAG TPA: RNA polymerase sigma factor [Candidatus Acidoferrales bacterium]|nr:RNA polymerase sigma factor [Candidatus Acidoferrales bacterium]